MVIDQKSTAIQILTYCITTVLRNYHGPEESIQRICSQYYFGVFNRKLSTFIVRAIQCIPDTYIICINNIKEK